jgi:hypothetical protein
MNEALEVKDGVVVPRLRGASGQFALDMDGDLSSGQTVGGRDGVPRGWGSCGRWLRQSGHRQPLPEAGAAVVSFGHVVVSGVKVLLPFL